MEDKARLDRLERIVAGYGVQKAPGVIVDGEDALNWADGQQWSAFLGLGMARNDIGEIAAAIAEHAAEQGVSAGDVVDEIARRLGGVK